MKLPGDSAAIQRRPYKRRNESQVIDPEEGRLWADLYKDGRVPFPELPLSVDALIQAVENADCRGGLGILMRVLADHEALEAHAAIERWLDSPDAEIADLAFCNASSGVPMRAWGDRIMNRIASTPAHPRRYQAMILLNAMALRRPLFESALTDPDPKVRTAAYSSFAIHGRLEHLVRLVKGLDDSDPEVREHVVDLFLEVLSGSDIDNREPLLERNWGKDQTSSFHTLVSDLTKHLKQLAKAESGELKDKANWALAWLPDGI